MKKQKISVAVLFGGVSPEHEVSIITGLQAMENVDRRKFNAIPVYISKSGRWFTGPGLAKIETYRNLLKISEKTTHEVAPFDHREKSLKPLTEKWAVPFFQKTQKNQRVDVVLPCFHGGLGENGGLAGMLELVDVPYVGPGVVGGVLGIDKVVTKQILHDKGIPITKYQWFFRNSWEKDRNSIMGKVEKSLKFPVFAKPASGGSSIGAGKAINRQELEKAIEVAATFDRKIIVEESFENSREINISVMGNAGTDDIMLSVCEEVFSSGEILSYEDKYVGSSKNGSQKGMARARREVPAKIPLEIEKKIQETAIDVFNLLESSGVARIDFLYREKTGEIVVLENNTIPGSLAFYLWEASGISFELMLTKLIGFAIERYNDNKKNITTFPNNLLENFNSPGSKGAKKLQNYK